MMIFISWTYSAAGVTPEQSVDGNVDERLDAAVALDHTQAYTSANAGHRFDLVHTGPKRNVGN